VLEDEADLPRLRRLPDRLLAPDADGAGIGRGQSRQQPEQGRLAAARGAEQRQQLAVVDVEADVVQRLESAEGVGKVPDFNVHGVLGAIQHS